MSDTQTCAKKIRIAYNWHFPHNILMARLDIYVKLSAVFCKTKAISTHYPSSHVISRTFFHSHIISRTFFHDTCGRAAQSPFWQWRLLSYIRVSSTVHHRPFPSTNMWDGTDSGSQLTVSLQMCCLKAQYTQKSDACRQYQFYYHHAKTVCMQ